MVLADVVAEEIDSLMLLARIRVVRRCRCGRGQSVQMRAPEHVRFTHCARRDSDGSNCSVELRMRGREEELVEEAACLVRWEHWEHGDLRARGEAMVWNSGGGRRDVHD